MKKLDVAIAKPALGNIGPIQFIRQAATELKKVTWPTRAQTIKLTAIVIGVSTAVSLYITGLDYIFTLLTEAIIR